MGLFGPACMKKDRIKALKAMNEELFRKSALSDPSWQVRQTAVR